MTEGSVVYLIQRGMFRNRDGGYRTPNIESAHQHGRLVEIFSMKDRPSQDPVTAWEKARTAFRNFDPVHDHILWAGGDPVSMLVTGAVLNSYEIKSVSYLRWQTQPGDPPTGYYVPMRLQFAENL
jgi:hypothetical protein